MIAFAQAGDPTMKLAVLVFAFASITALATGLGVIPFLFLRSVSRASVAYSNAIASGLMLGASFGLLAEGMQHASWQPFVGANLGILFVLTTGKILEGRQLEFGSLRGLSAQKVALIVIVMAVHSFAEGVAVGAAFAGGIALATFVTVAIAVHNIPEAGSLAM